MLRTTEIGAQKAGWRITVGGIAMESLSDLAATHRPGYRVLVDGSVADVSDGVPGTVYFGRDGARPDLAQVRDWFPRYVALWDAVRAQYWDAILPLDRPRFRGPGNLTAMTNR